MHDAKFISLNELSDRTGLSAAWLKARTDEGVLPVLVVGRRRMFDLEAVRAALAEMAATSRATLAGKGASNASS